MVVEMVGTMVDYWADLKATMRAVYSVEMMAWKKADYSVDMMEHSKVEM